MGDVRFGDPAQLPEEIRDLCTGLCEDVAVLHLKLSFYRELFSIREHAALLSSLAPAFFHIVAESLRNDIILGICRLSDPSRNLIGDNRSLATLVGRCTKVPKV